MLQQSDSTPSLSQISHPSIRSKLSGSDPIHHSITLFQPFIEFLATPNFIITCYSDVLTSLSIFDILSVADLSPV